MRLRMLAFAILPLLVLVLLPGACRKAVPAAPVSAPPVAPPPPPAVPPAITLGADRTTITAGQSVTLSWKSSGATAVTIDNAVGNVDLSGSRQVTPQVSTRYTATAKGAGGTTASGPLQITVNVVPVVAPQPTITPQPPPAARVPTLAEQFEVAMQSIYFDYDQSAIAGSETAKLQASARWLAQNPSVRFTIEGNADERGSQEYNIALGDERTAAVRKFLAGLGIVEGRMDGVSYGEERPLCKEPNEGCWHKNRRAQFTLKR